MLLALPETGETEGNLPEVTSPKNEKTREKSRAFVTLAGSTGNQRVERRGHEQPAHFPRNQGVPSDRAAESAADPAGNRVRPAESVSGGVLADPLIDRLALAWPGLTEADRAVVVELAERLTATHRDTVAIVE